MMVVDPAMPNLAVEAVNWFTAKTARTDDIWFRTASEAASDPPRPPAEPSVATDAGGFTRPKIALSKEQAAVADDVPFDPAILLQHCWPVMFSGRIVQAGR